MIYVTEEQLKSMAELLAMTSAQIKELDEESKLYRENCEYRESNLSKRIEDLESDVKIRSEKSKFLNDQINKQKEDHTKTILSLRTEIEIYKNKLKILDQEYETVKAAVEKERFSVLRLKKTIKDMKNSGKRRK